MGNSEKKLKPECKIFVRNFLGATTQCMADYIKLSIRAKPNQFMIHVGTNDSNSSRPPDEIAKTIIDLASAELDKKGNQVNHHLKEMCNRKNFLFIDQSKKIKASHLKSSKLHSNRTGANILRSSLIQHISKLFN